VIDLVLIYEQVTSSASVIRWLALHSWKLNSLIIEFRLNQSNQSQIQCYFTTGGLLPISSSSRQALWDPRPEFFQLNPCGNIVCCLRVSMEPFVASVNIESAFRMKSAFTNLHLHRTCVSESLSSNGLFRLSGIMSRFIYIYLCVCVCMHAHVHSRIRTFYIISISDSQVVYSCLVSWKPENLNIRDYLKELNIGGRILLNFILVKHDLVIWTRLIWSTIKTTVFFLWSQRWTCRLQKEYFYSIRQIIYRWFNQSALWVSTSSAEELRLAAEAATSIFRRACLLPRLFLKVGVTSSGQ
jgi:hypothetical protein